MTQYIGTAPAREKRHKVFTGDISDLSAETEESLLAKYEIPPETLFNYNVGWCYDEGRLVLPVYNSIGHLLGHSLRDISGKLKPKVLSYREPGISEGEQLIGWYTRGGTVPSSMDWIVVVEDQISALKINSLGFNAVALLGCDLTLQKMMAISRKYQKVVIFLDYDALDSARRGIAKFGWLFKYTCILFDEHKRDPKDIPREELRTKLREEDARIKDISGGVG